MTKDELRKQIRTLKKAADAADLERQSLQVCETVSRHPRWQQASTVLLYHALPDEVDTHGLIEAAVREEKTVLLPVVVGDTLELRVFDGALSEGAFHILEPTASAALFTQYEQISLAIIPGMGFDRNGHRLGRGKGYYDRLLCQCPSLYKIGVCFDFQLLDNVPSENHDIVMNEVLSS